MDDVERARRRDLGIALAVALPVFALLAARTWFTCDDAYISFRYARHFAHGDGLVFNLGESPPVEGYSNFLWVVWLAACSRAGLDLPLAAAATSFACGAALVALVARCASVRLGLDRLGTCATALFAALLPPLTLWSTGGLETMPFALCTFACFSALAIDPARPRPWLSGACALLAALLRADGALWAGLAILAATLSAGEHVSAPVEPRAQQRGGRWTAASIALAILCAGTLVHVLWRHSYHGEWLPNTARVKAGFSALRLERGLFYAVSFALAVPVALLVPLAALAARGQPSPRLALAAALVMAGATAYAIDIGGDFMPMGRFVIAAMPFVVLLFALVWKRLARPRAIAFALPVLALAPLPSFDVNVVPQALRELVHFRWNETRCISEAEMAAGMRQRAESWALLGRALGLHTQPGESIVLGNVGAVGFFSELHVYDLFGLVSPEVAAREAPLVRASPGHDRRVEPEFFFDRKPTYLNAGLAQAGRPLEGMPPAWSALVSAGRVRLERIALREADGFPPATELVLLRFVWNP